MRIDRIVALYGEHDEPNNGEGDQSVPDPFTHRRSLADPWPRRKAKAR